MADPLSVMAVVVVALMAVVVVAPSPHVVDVITIVQEVFHKIAGSCAQSHQVAKYEGGLFL